MSLNALRRLDDVIRDAGVPIHGVALIDEATHAVRIDFIPSATDVQITAANGIVAAFDWSAGAQTTWENQQARVEAKNQLTNSKAQGEKLLRALALVLLDEINTLRGAVTPTLAARTPAQLMNAIRNKLDAGTAD